MRRFLVCCAIAAIAAACDRSTPAGKTASQGTSSGTPTAAARGAQLFDQFCMSCHGSRGNGRGSRGGPSLQRSTFTYGRNARDIKASIRSGRPGGMPAFDHVLDDAQLTSLADYILSLAP